MGLHELGVQSARQLRMRSKEARPSGLFVRSEADGGHSIVVHTINSSGEQGLVQRVRPPAGEPSGALLLFHGRGVDENDLFPLLDELDPERRLLGATARAPLTLPPGGYHWYAVHRIGYPDPPTFHSTYPMVAAWIDDILGGHGVTPDRAVLGGFSQGAVMSYALGLGAGRPRPAGILAFSGFIPTVDGFELDLARAEDLPVAIGHGEHDPIIGVEWGRGARDTLERAGARVTYRESPMPHTIDPGFLAELRGWVERTTSDISM